MFITTITVSSISSGKGRQHKKNNYRGPKREQRKATPQNETVTVEIIGNIRPSECSGQLRTGSMVVRPIRIHEVTEATKNKL